MRSIECACVDCFQENGNNDNSTVSATVIGVIIEF